MVKNRITNYNTSKHGLGGSRSKQWKVRPELYHFFRGSFAPDSLSSLLDPVFALPTSLLVFVMDKKIVTVNPKNSICFSIKKDYCSIRQ